MKYALKPIGNGVWEIKLKPEALHHGQLYKMLVHWEGGMGERIPAYATRVVQDEQSKIFSAQVWAPEKPFKWKVRRFVPDTRPLLIYECHIGMAQEREGVGTYSEFTEKILPIIKRDGYNAVQLMAIAEHPYYGSFGYHVSSFFAPSSRFGTPEELKELESTILTAKDRIIALEYELFTQLRQAVAAESARVKQTAQAIAQRTSVMRKTVSDNELFTFRVWLVRMGLNGDEFKNTRDHLLANLEGNRAWRYDKDCYASSHKNRTSQQEQER